MFNKYLSIVTAFCDHAHPDAYFQNISMFFGALLLLSFTLYSARKTVMSWAGRFWFFKNVLSERGLCPFLALLRRI